MGVVIPGGGYSEDRASGAVTLNGSLRFNSASTHYLSRTPGSAGNRRKFTCSVWVKRTGILASLVDVPLMDAGPDSTNFGISGTGALGSTYDGRFYIRNGGANLCKIPNALFRDPTAWYHFVFAVDTENGTPADRQILYVNGVRQENFDGSFTQNTDTAINNTVAHSIGANVGPGSSGYHGNMYLSEYNFIDGQALTPSSFGFTDPLTNTWRPKKYTGTYGTNGFYLPLDNNDAKGTDRSGNNNNWTANNFTGTFSNPDVVPDSPSGIVYNTAPTAGIGTTTGITKPSNYCTLNPLDKNSSQTPKDGNLYFDGSVSTGGLDVIAGTMRVTSGKYYWESTITNVGSTAVAAVGITKIQCVGRSNGGSLGNVTGECAYLPSGNKQLDGSSTAYGASFTTNDVIGVALDCDAGTVTFYKNNTSQGSISYAVGSGLSPAFGQVQGYGAIQTVNFGQRPFKYTPPAGFLSLCTANLSRPSIVRPDQHFYIHLYTGNGSTQTITGFPFQPEFTWIKERGTNVGGTGGHRLYDCVRGYSNGYLSSNTTTGQTASGTINNTPNGSDPPYGLTLGTDNDLNESNTYVAWNWKAGGPIGVGRSVSINGVGYATTTAAGLTAGTIAPTGASINTKSGFSIITYTGNATSGATVSHGLGTTPAMVIIKSTTVTTNWYVWHQGLTQPDYQVYLNLNDGQDTSVTTFLNDKAPTSSVFELPGTGFGSNNSGATYVAYCWAEIPGFSKFGSYVGNNSSDGPMVYCGFRPAWILCKNISRSAMTWIQHDSKRSTYNPATNSLATSSSSAEPYDTASPIDILSNGFKLRGGSSSYNNYLTTDTYIYAAFAETPTANLFGGQSNAR